MRKRRQLFLDHLAVHCNVDAAAKAAEVPHRTLYRWRAADTDFAAAWSAALAAGYEMLEMRLVAHALAGGTGTETGAALAPVDVELALKLLGVHRHAKGKPRAGRPVGFATQEETDRVFLGRLEAIEKRRAAAKAEEA